MRTVHFGICSAVVVNEIRVRSTDMNRNDTYRLKIGLFGCEISHTFCHALKVESDDEATPKRSIFRSPFRSIGIGSASEEAGAVR